MIGRRVFGLGAASLALSACVKKQETPLAHLYGQDWVHGAYELYAGKFRDVQASTEADSFASYAVLAQKGVTALDALQSREVPFFVRADEGSRAFRIERDVPERLTFTAGMTEKDRAAATEAWNRAREHIQSDYEEIRRLDGALTRLFAQLVRIRRAIDAAREEQLELVRQLAPVAAGKAPYQLPYQVSIGDYERIVDLLIERLDDDRPRLANVEASIVAVGLVARATDANSGSLAANLHRVLLAVVDDAQASTPREARFPKSDADRDRLVAKGKSLAEAIRATDEYRRYERRVETKDFEAIGSMLSVLDATGLPVSAVYRQLLDVWRGDGDYLGYVKTALSVVPGGGKLADVLRDAVDKTERARTVLEKAGSLDVEALAKAKAGVLLNTGSSYARERVKKQLVFFRDGTDANDALEALRGTPLLRGPG